VHSIVVGAPGYFAIQLDAPVVVKYPLIVLVATGLTLVAYKLMRRWNVTRWLFGMKPEKKGCLSHRMRNSTGNRCNVYWMRETG
jgi:hypothetical protein